MAGRRTIFVNTSLTEPTRDRLQALTMRMQSAAGRRLSMSVAVETMADLAERHWAEVEAALQKRAESEE